MSDAAAERELLDRFRSGEPDAFDALVRLHADAVYRFAIRLTGRAQEAEDVAQETFARALRHGREFREESGFRTWLFRIAINLERDAARRRLASPVVERDGAIDAEVAESFDRRSPAGDEADARERLAALRARIEALPRLQRETLVLRVFEELPYVEIAAILGISVGAAKMNLLYARRKLAAFLDSARVAGAEDDVDDERDPS